MTKLFQLIVTLTLILVSTEQTTYGQNKSMTFSNDLNAYYNQTRPKDTLKGLAGFRFFEPKIKRDYFKILMQRLNFGAGQM